MDSSKVLKNSLMEVTEAQISTTSSESAGKAGLSDANASDVPLYNSTTKINFRISESE